MAGLGFNYRPEKPDMEWREYFAGYTSTLREHKAAVANPARIKMMVDVDENGDDFLVMQEAKDDRTAAQKEEDEEGEDDEGPVQITEPGHEIDAAKVKSLGPKKVITGITGAGWEVHAYQSRTYEVGAVYKSGQREGQKRPDKDLTHLIVTGKLEGNAALQSVYVDGRFKYAFVQDAVGWPTEAFFDYKPSKSLKEWLGEERAIMRGHRQDADYNDGFEWIDKGRRLERKATDFEEWLADVVPGFVARKRAVKKEEEPADLAAPIATGEWIG